MLSRFAAGCTTHFSGVSGPGRDETVETSILSFVDDSHPAATELFDDAVMRDGLADRSPAHLRVNEPPFGAGSRGFSLRPRGCRRHFRTLTAAILESNAARQRYKAGSRLRYLPETEPQLRSWVPVPAGGRKIPGCCPRS